MSLDDDAYRAAVSDVERLLATEEQPGPAALRLAVHLVDGRPRASAWAAPYRPPRTLRRRGAALHPVTVPAGPLTGHKTCSYLPLRWARERARHAGCDAALLVDADGTARETDHGNLFLRLGSVVLTPPAPDWCLPGVMRAWCAATLQALGVDVRESRFPLTELDLADEVWTTSSLEGVLPVRAIRRRDLAVPGPLVARLQARPVPVPGW